MENSTFCPLGYTEVKPDYCSTIGKKQVTQCESLLLYTFLLFLPGALFVEYSLRLSWSKLSSRIGPESLAQIEEY